MIACWDCICTTQYWNWILWWWAPALRSCLSCVCDASLHPLFSTSATVSNAVLSAMSWLLWNEVAWSSHLQQCILRLLQRRNQWEGSRLLVLCSCCSLCLDFTFYRICCQSNSSVLYCSPIPLVMEIVIMQPYKSYIFNIQCSVGSFTGFACGVLLLCVWIQQS